MRIDHPSPRHVPALRRLWQQVFGDTDDFLDSFFRTAYSPLRCRCMLEGDQVLAVLYWIDCGLDGQKLAYLYAVATHPDHRGRGLCRRLLADTHDLLQAQGYSGVILVPQEEGLRAMYRKMGYENATALEESSCAAGDSPVPLRAVGPAEFAALRRELLPAGGVIQEGEGLAFLAEEYQFYAGEGFLLTGNVQGDLFYGAELLGQADPAGILKALHCAKGVFRRPGKGKGFAMFRPLTAEAKQPAYLGFAFD